MAGYMYASMFKRCYQSNLPTILALMPGYICMFQCSNDVRLKHEGETPRRPLNAVPSIKMFANPQPSKKSVLLNKTSV